MSQGTANSVLTARGHSLARSFSMLGWIGFWVQVVFGSIPILLMIYYLAFSSSASVIRSGFPFIEYFTIANLLVLLFTLFWSYRYTMLARRIADPARRPSAMSVIRTVWTGVIASTAAMLLSSIILTLEGGNLLFNFLKAPQGGIPTIQTAGGVSNYLVSSIDMVSLMALILTQFAELLVLTFSLCLLFRATSASAEYADPANSLEASPAPTVTK
jgi:hypothetical protein